jgi:hypothetical protein
MTPLREGIMARIKTVLLLSVLLLALLGFGHAGHAEAPPHDPGGTARQAPLGGKDPGDNPVDQEYEELQEELRQLMEEMKRLEQAVRTKVRREILPRIREEVERLRKWLEELHPEKEVPEPLNTRAGALGPA